MSLSVTGGESSDQHPEDHVAKPKKRVITAARQEQNRAAQRAYRERQKERKKSLAHDGRVRRLAPRSSTLSSSSPQFSSETQAEQTSSSAMVRLSPSSGRRSTSPLLLADPISNSLQTSEDAIRVALLHNAICLGFDLSQLMSCVQPYMSPFYRCISEEDRPQDVIASTFDTSIPLHLQPTMAQILIPHHASLDLIPMPLLRERAIMKAFAMPNDFNLWDLKLDIYSRHALVVRRHRAAGTSQPWDPKNWEATPWFLKKWSMTFE